MPRRNKKHYSFNAKLYNFTDIFEFIFKHVDEKSQDYDKNFSMLFEYIAIKMKKFRKRSSAELEADFVNVFMKIINETKGEEHRRLIFLQVLPFLTSQLGTLRHLEVYPNYNDIIPKELRHTHYDGQAITDVKPTLTLNYTQLLKIAEQNGKPIKPVRRQKKSTLPEDMCCPHCNAPTDYLYKNMPNQILCKCCALTSVINRSKYPVPHNNRCPHCNWKLDFRKGRSGFDVYRCSNPKCSFYSSSKAKALEIISRYPHFKLQDFKLHYTFRKYFFDIEFLKGLPINYDVFDSVNRYESITKRLNFFQSQLFLMCLAYRHNYSLSKTKIASILGEIHDHHVSSQTVDNYLQIIADILKPFVESYPYKVSNRLTADETYIKINGEQYYLYRFYDYNTGIVISQYLSDSRDTTSTYNALNKCLTTIKDSADLSNLTLIVDGYSPYQIVVNHINSENKDVNINTVQVIGLKNHHEDIKPYVPDKQAIERNHRNFKMAYHNSTNFRSVKAALAYCTLDQAVNNFITTKRRTSLIPVKLRSLNKNDGIMDRWEKLIFEAISYLQNNPANVA